MRYICTFYETSSKMNVDRTNKKVKIIECAASNLVEGKLREEHGAKFIKSIRNLKDDRNYTYSNELKYIELANNNQLDAVWGD